MDENRNVAIKANEDHKSAVESAYDYLEHFDILETITNVGNDEVFTPRKTCDMILNSLPEEVWHNPNYRWLNPATKNGIFEREIAIRLDKGLKNIIPDEETRRKHILQNMIFAIGQTKFTANVARRTLYYCCQANRKCDGVKSEDGHYVNGYAIGNGSWFDDYEGNIKTPKADHIFDKNGKCKFCGMTNTSKYNSLDQREHYAYEFIHYDKIVLERHLQRLFFKGDRNMKFDVIIGNPPYQLSVNESGKGLGAVPIYQMFVENAISLNPRYISMIIPSRWFTGGVGLDDFRKKFLKDTRITKITDFTNSNDCFPTTDINGGVCYFLWERDKNSKCLFTNITNGLIKCDERSLDEFPIVIRYSDALSILRKVLSHKDKKFSDGFVSAQTPYGLLSTFVGNKEKNNSDDLDYLSSKGWSFVEKSKIKKGVETIDKYKVLISKLTCEHAGTPDKNGQYRVLSRTELLKPGQICSQSYLIINATNNIKIAENTLSYLKTKFARFLIQITLTGMNLSIDNFKFLPFLDFNKSYNDIELYSKYDLNTDEINFIEKIIREMN